MYKKKYCPYQKMGMYACFLTIYFSAVTTNQNHKRKKRYYDSPTMAEDGQQRKMKDLPKHLLNKNIIEEPPIEDVAASPGDKEFVGQINSILSEMGSMNSLPSILGDSCQDSRQCQDGAECLNGICQCGGEYFQAGSFCILRTTSKKFWIYRVYKNRSLGDFFMFFDPNFFFKNDPVRTIKKNFKKFKKFV
jgi:hypothetical protein